MSLLDRFVLGAGVVAVIGSLKSILLGLIHHLIRATLRSGLFSLILGPHERLLCGREVGGELWVGYDLGLINGVGGSWGIIAHGTEVIGI